MPVASSQAIWQLLSENDEAARHLGVGLAQHNGIRTRALSATKDFQQDEVILASDSTRVIRAADLQGRRFEGCPDDACRLALHVAERAKTGRDSFWTKALAAYPSFSEFEALGMPLAASERALAVLNQVPDFQALATSVRQTRGAMLSALESYNRHSTTQLNFADALWGRLVVDSGLGDVRCGPHVAPVLDWVNHSTKPNVRYECHDGRVTLQALRRIRTGEELQASYNQLGPMANFARYGIIEDPGEAKPLSPSSCTRLQIVSLDKEPVLRAASKFAQIHCGDIGARQPAASATATASTPTGAAPPVPKPEPAMETVPPKMGKLELSIQPLTQIPGVSNLLFGPRPFVPLSPSAWDWAAPTALAQPPAPLLALLPLPSLAPARQKRTTRAVGMRRNKRQASRIKTAYFEMEAADPQVPQDGAVDELQPKLPADPEQGHLVTNHTNHNSTSAAALRRVWNFQVHGTSPRLQHPCGVLDFEISMGKLALLGTGHDAFERPYEEQPGQWTLAVSACFGQLSSFEERTSRLLQQKALRPFLVPSSRPSLSRARRKSAPRSLGGLARGEVVVKPEFLQPSEASGKFRDGELKKVSLLAAWEERCAFSVERSEEKNEGEHCLAQGCVAYCGLWQMVQAARDDDLQLLLNVTDRASRLVNDLASERISAFEFAGKVWPHWATFQHYLPGGKHILHPDTDKGEHCMSLAVSFSTHGVDFTGGEIKIYECPPSVPDCGNRGRSRTHVPKEGGPFARKLLNGTLLPLRAGEWLWDGEPEAAYHVRQLLRPASGTAMVWLSETVHQVEPVQGGHRKSLFYWFTCKEPLQDAAFDWTGLAQRLRDPTAAREKRSGARPPREGQANCAGLSETWRRVRLRGLIGCQGGEEDGQGWPKKSQGPAEVGKLLRAQWIWHGRR
ncbi:Fe2OG dioxygenase domain-containing protein [Durusdinium trenchii]|uniref:Fe2OG dioxygenase domain-containing protein n=1 Tax=Durusdinium trenchii TaxID=1381693 RepID=A0ABP0NST3_9DINO